MALKERILAGGRLRILVYIASQLISWSIALVTIRFLVPEDYGVMAVAVVVMSLAGVIAALGLPIYILQTRRMRRDLLRRIAGVVVVSFAVMAALVAICAPLAAEFLKMPALQPVLLVLCACLVVRSFGIAPGTWLQRVIKFKDVAAIEASSTIVSALVGLALAIEGHGALALAGRAFATATIGTALGMWITRGRMLPIFRLTGLREPLRFGVRIVVTKVLEVIQINADRLILARMIGAEALGLYSLGTAIGRMAPQLIMTPVTRIVLPALSRFDLLDPRRARYIVRGNGLLAFMFFPLSWGGALVAPYLVTLALGQGWSGVVPIFQVIAVYLPIHLLSRMVAPALIAAGRPDADIRNVTVRLLLVAVATATGAFFGPFWAAVGWVGGSFVGLIVNMRHSLPILGIGYRELAGEIGATAACAGLMAISVWGLIESRWLEGGGVIWELVASVSLGAAVYVASSSLLNRAIMRRVIATVLNRKRGARISV